MSEISASKRQELQPQRSSLREGVAVVTGAARGIGKAAAIELARWVGTLILMDELEDELCKTATMLEAMGPQVHPISCDVSEEGAQKALVEILERCDAPTTLINAAGIVKRVDIGASLGDDLTALWRVNVFGTVAITQCVLPRMIGAGYGKIINIGSIGSVRGLAKRTAYATTKGAISQFTMSLATEVGKFGVRVNAVAPGYVETDMTRSWLNESAERRAKLLSRIPLGRFATPDDVVGTLMFLASGASDYITGQTLLVDGGWTTT